MRAVTAFPVLGMGIYRVTNGGCSMSFRAVASLLREELEARGWTTRDVAVTHAKHECAVKELELDLLLAVADDPTVSDGQVLMGDDDLAVLDRAFGVSDGFFRRLYESPETVDAVDPQDGGTPE